MAKNTGKPITNANVAHITPAILTWAIRRSSYSRETLAKRLGISPEELTRWERGTPPPMEKAERLASLLGIPFGFFYLASPPNAGVPIPDRRRLNVGYKPSQNFLELLNDVLVRRDWYRDYATELREAPLPFVGKFSVESDVKVVADIRRVLSLGPEFRHSEMSWANYGAALAKRAEERRILVMRSSVVANDGQKPVSRLEVQGFAIADPIAPVVFVNSSDYKSAQIFTLTHEFAHLWIGDTAISNPNQGESQSNNRIERFCDRVATETLVPEAEFRPLWRVKTLKAELGLIDELAMTYWVSSLVIIRRASELNLISADEMHRLRKRAVAAQRKNEPKGRPTFYRLAAVRAGHRLTEAVRSEVESGSLIHSHASRLLGMNAATFGRFMGTSRTP